MKDHMHSGAEIGRVFVELPVSQLLDKGLVRFVQHLCSAKERRLTGSDVPVWQ